MRTLLLALLLAGPACSGNDDDEVPACEQDCRDIILIPCRDNCDETCGEDDVCRDTCHGDCIGQFDACVARDCASE